ncbi:MAG: tRNA (N6-isopentenyl adenosine(37)-C2)-methylthiotransferase MiaB, partial [Lachnospiraceae bacterium]|nr:tRNA (N6-isopentenyl adenosine(37)-C2)-methylthiotransferase MiaB [Lachnospiraceae bacterium]
MLNERDLTEYESLPVVPENEPERQFYYMAQIRKLVKKRSEELGRPLTAYHLVVGCQMNAKDSEKLLGVLLECGYVETDSEPDADFVIYNTCSIRENANQKVYGRLGVLGSKKKQNPEMIIALCGCMMQEKTVVEKIRQSYKFVDIIFGTHNNFKLPELLYNRLVNHESVVDIWEDTTMIVEDLPAKRVYPFKSGVNIMYGCNNFCTYCIVPYVRGREKSRDSEEILSEIHRLVADGVVEVMLLGQNVNSYGKNLAEPMTFAQLLQKVEEIPGLERIRFMTSHPKDLSDELIEVMKNSKKICRHLHLPLQSGSSEVLKRMNRRYTKEHYIELAEKIRREIPDIALTTDIIVGFPGETEEDFEETMEVVERIRYDSAFTFLYSKRTGTPAATFEDQVPKDVAQKRFDRLLER